MSSKIYKKEKKTYGKCHTICIIQKSTRKKKKLMVSVIQYGVPTKKIHFGAKGYEDYTIHGDIKRRESYIKRHRPNENWTLSGILSAGFWSRWILWSCTTLKESATFTKEKFGIDIFVHRNLI